MEKVTALECSQNGKDFYITCLSSSLLKEICYLSRRDEDKVKGFQRSLDIKRAKDIAKYLDIDNGCLPTNLILSAQKESKITYSKEKKELCFDKNPNGFMVLDGQHRLYGLWLSDKEYLIPVAIITGLNIKDEVNLFIDINTNQKGVNPNLLLDIKGLAGKESNLEERQTKLFNLLNENSPLINKLLATSSKVGYISKKVFNESTKEFLENGFFADKEINYVYQGFNNYLIAAELVFTESENEKAKLTTANIFEALCIIFNDCIDKSFQLYNNLKVENLQSILQPISRLSYENYGSNKSGLKKLVADMKKEINQYDTKYRNVDEDSIF